jgi:hypothetical protein
VAQFASHYPRIKAAGAEVLLVSFYPPDRLAAWARANRLPYRLAADPDRDAYRRYGLGDGKLADLVGPQTWMAGLRAFARTPRIPEHAQHWQQLGGYFVVNGEGNIVYAYPSKGTTDHPDPQSLLEALGVESGGHTLDRWVAPSVGHDATA